MTEEEFKLQTRLKAIEYVLQDAVKLIYLQIGVTPENMAQRHANISASLSAETIPGADPVLSDAALDEVQENVRLLLAGVETMMEEGWRKRGLHGRS